MRFITEHLTIIIILLLVLVLVFSLYYLKEFQLRGDATCVRDLF